jgi:hypothetical protein
MNPSKVSTAEEMDLRLFNLSLVIMDQRGQINSIRSLNFFKFSIKWFDIGNLGTTQTKSGREKKSFALI